MENNKKINLVEHTDEDVKTLRKKYNLDAPGRMEEAVQLLDDWLKQHPYIINSDCIPKSTLDIGIINAKGSLERTKSRIINTLVLKRTLPEFLSAANYSPTEFRKISSITYFAIYPKLDDNLYRYSIVKANRGPYSTELYLTYLRFSICAIHYVCVREYCDGFVVVLDYSDIKLMDALPAINIVDLKKFTSILVHGFGMRLKGLHIILGPSAVGKVLDMMLGIVKALVPEKLGSRIHLHRSVESLTNMLQKNRLPAEYGDESNMSIKELHELWMDAICSEEHMESLRRFDKIHLDESYKGTEEFNDYGLPGSFRKLNVD